MTGQSRCESCGGEIEAGVRFCRHCGTPRAPLPDEQGAPSHGFASPSQGQPPSYPPPPPGYFGASAPQPMAPPGHLVQQGYAPVAYPAPSPSSGSGKGWLIGAIAAGIVALAGLGVGLYFAISGGGGQARLLAAPTITTASGATETSASSRTPSRSSTRTAASSSSSPPPRPVVLLPPAVAAATSSPSATASGASGLGEQRAVADTIQRHFSLIRGHHFSAAYALLAPSLQTGESSWIAAHREDGIYSVEVAVQATLHSPVSATAKVAKMTTLDSHGCKNWSGTWSLQKIAGAWRISEANVTATPC